MYDKAPLAQRSGTDRFASGFAAPAVRRPGAAKEQMTAWERWEMTSLAQDMTPVPAEPAPTPVVEPLKPELLIDENELARLRLQARQAGAEEGRQQGYAQGQPEGHAAAMAAAGCEVHTYPASEIGINGSGGPTCMTRPILRG